MELTWQKSFAARWLDLTNQGRMPHAVLLAGAPGVGKRPAAAWMASQRLNRPGATELPVYPFSYPDYPDLRWILTPEDKKSIGIDQIRALVDHLSLTSYEGAAKVAVIDPANDMTANAANSLLKTLEEPPGDTLVILIADRVGTLPATILSRCHRVDFNGPGEQTALQWLEQLRPGAPWVDALRAAGGAPLAAVEALDDLETGALMAQDLAALGRGAGSAVEVAARWAKLDPGFVLGWLSRQVRLAAIAVFAGRTRADGLAIDDSVLRRMDRRNLFCYLDIINRLRGQPGGSYNVHLTFEGLLIDWANGLQNCNQGLPNDGMEFVRTR